MKLNISKIDKKQSGGGLSRDEDYKSKSKPYPTVKKADFAGKDRSYPIPTKADAVDALRLAGLHGREDVKQKVYSKYPELKKHQQGGKMQSSFWGINNNQYTDNYMNSVNDIMNNPDKLKMAMVSLNLKGVSIPDSKTFYKLATDKIVGPVHNYIKQLPLDYKFDDSPSIMTGYIKGREITDSKSNIINKFGKDFQKLTDRGGQFEVTQSKYIDPTTKDTVSFDTMLSKVRTFKKLQEGGSTPKRENFNIKPVSTPLLNLQQYVNTSLIQKPDATRVAIPDFISPIKKQMSEQDKFINYWKGVENNTKTGYKEGKWFPHKSVEGGTPTIAYGLKFGVNPEFDKIAEKGATDEQIDNELKNRINSSVNQVEKIFERKYGKGSFNNLSDKQKYGLVEIHMNTGNVSKFPKFMEAIKNNDITTAISQSKRGVNGKPLTTRNLAFANYLKQ